jgi:hypothetical protein
MTKMNVVSRLDPHHEILAELKKPTATEQLAWTEKKRRLAEAAEALLPDYTTGGELTAFTALDGEDFYA